MARLGRYRWLRPRRVALWALLGVLAGCGKSGPETAPVAGKITVEGKPVAGVAVMFLPLAGGRPATGVTDASGAYRLQTFKDFDGVLLGDHRVTVVLPGMGSSEGTRTAEGVALSGSSTTLEAPAPTGYEKYARPEESGLTAQVTRVSGSFDFDLKPPR
jgi:hypothetical protein